MQTRSPFIHKIFVSRGDGTLSINSLNILLFKFVEGKQTILICVCAFVLCLALLTMTSLTLAAASWASAWPPGSWGRASSCAGIHRSDLNAIRLIVDVKDTLLDLVVDLPGGVDEGLLHIGGGLGRGLHEDEPVLPGKRLTFLPFHISSSLQVTGDWKSKQGSRKFDGKTSCCLWAWSPCCCCCVAWHLPAKWSEKMQEKHWSWNIHLFEDEDERALPGDWMCPCA